MDLGFFLSHLLLKAVKNVVERQRYFELTRAFWSGYGGTEERLRHGIAHLGVCLLARIDGTSPVDYLPEETKREAVRLLGRGLLLNPPDNWDGVLALTESVV